MRKTLLFLITIIIGLIYFFYKIDVPNIGNDRSARKFDSKIWKTTDKEDGRREEMYNDLINNHLPLKITKKQVLEILGKSDNENKQGFEFSEKELGYLISYGFDPCFLSLEFDEKELLINRTIICH